VEAKEGLLERAHRGTLFLDEIGDMDMAVQAKFLKVLEEKRFRPLGRVEERISDFRLICATHQDLDKLITEGAFRQDLYYRINTLSITMPPLRERLEELPALVTHLLAFITGGRRAPQFNPEILPHLASYNWPGNLRELHNVLERAWILSDGNPIQVEHFVGLTPQAPLVEAPSTKEVAGLDAAEKSHIIKILKQSAGKVPVAAKLLGVSRATLYRKIAQHQIDLNDIR
jgi:transcriptional regulator with PAS, ATPase and Fis domain